MKNLIERQEAIDKIKKRLFETAFNNVGIKQNVDETLVDVAENRLENWFNELPSAQPELKELSEWKADFKGYINALNMPKDDYDGIMEYIDEVPSVQPERKTGRWIYGESEVGNDGYYCSECGNFVPWIYEESAMNFIREYKFCPNCGAKMEGGEQE